MTGADICLSLNEVETIAAKAARGAGLGWGHAEDLGRAARWLAARGFDWASALLRLLDDAEASSKAVRLAEATDRALVAGGRWTVDGLPPALLTPMLAASIFGRDHGLLVEWRDQAVSLALDGSAWSSRRLVDLRSDATVSVEAAADAPQLAFELMTFARPKPLPVAELDRLAAYGDRTLVPATAFSRARGAGSAGSDND